MAMNLGGATPEYWCDICKPPATAREIIDTIQAFTGLPKAEQK